MTAPATGQVCAGDCDRDGTVRVNELVLALNVALGRTSPAACAGSDRGDGSVVSIEELVAGVRNSASGCAAADEFVARASDFECLTNWVKVRRFRITNKLGHLDEALAVARREVPPPYPPGTIIQLIPHEAMVKRGGGFDVENHAWEYFVIDPSSGSTRIVQRGRTEVTNIGLPCFACHSAARSVDFICETGNGCPELNTPPAIIEQLQENDRRCR